MLFLYVLTLNVEMINNGSPSDENKPFHIAYIQFFIQRMIQNYCTQIQQMQSKARAQISVPYSIHATHIIFN